MSSRKKILFIALMLLGVFGSYAYGSSTRTVRTGSWGGSDVGGNGDWRAIYVTYNGRPLTCLDFRRNKTENGISCDWVAYHDLRGQRFP